MKTWRVWIKIQDDYDEHDIRFSSPDRWSTGWREMILMTPPEDNEKTLTDFLAGKKE